jgi:hypothetical protein
MNRYVRAATAALLMTSGLASLGCASRTGVTMGDRYRNAVDTTWPENYSFAARQAVIAPFAQQVANGHFIEQTIWNWYFEPGTEKLNGAGMEKLDSLAHSTPAPDPKIYIQAARDILVTAENADKVGTLRDDLTARRAVAVQRYLATQPGATVAYELAVTDAPTPGINASFAASAYRGQAQGYKGGIGGGGASANAVGGGSGSIQPPSNGNTTVNVQGTPAGSSSTTPP